MMTQETTYTIQQISDMTGLSKYTLRYYEDIELLDPVARASNGHRCYAEADYRRIMMLVKLRKTHMSIDDMKYFVNLYRQGHQTASERRELLTAHRKVVEAQVDELCQILEFIDFKIGLYKEEEEVYCEQHEISPTG